MVAIGGALVAIGVGAFFALLLGRRKLRQLSAKEARWGDAILGLLLGWFGLAVFVFVLFLLIVFGDDIRRLLNT